MPLSRWLQILNAPANKKKIDIVKNKNLNQTNYFIHNALYPVKAWPHWDIFRDLFEATGYVAIPLFDSLQI